MTPHDRGRNRRTAFKLGLAGVGMFAFALFVLPPLYDLACEVLGINGKASRTGAAPAVAVDRSRTVTVGFLANVHQNTPLEFRAPKPYRREVHPGERTVVTYVARNLTNTPLRAQAVHSITPGVTSRYIDVIECFCFKQQKFEPGEERELTLAFRVRPTLPGRYREIGVSYTFFKLTPAGDGKPNET